MNMKTTRATQCIIISCIAHICLILGLFALANIQSILHQQFIVLGAHSSAQQLTTYRPLLAPPPHVPFVTPPVQTKKIVNDAEKSEKKPTIAAPPPPVVQQKKQELQTKKPTPAEQKKQKSVEKKIKEAAKQPTKKEPKLSKKVAATQPTTTPEPIKKQTEAHVTTPLKSEVIADEQEISIQTGSQEPQEMSQYQRYITDEFTRCWKPPVGVPQGTTCIITFSINGSGSVDHFAIKEPSTMLLYDLSITRIVKQLTFNRYLWGKTFTVHFCQ